jgi:carbonic anhydrase/acetyltransferase-like protein (isoleucine patch superfamily)
MGRGSRGAPGAVVTERSVIPPGSIVAGVPGRVIKTRNCSQENRMNAWNYWWNARAYMRGDHRSWESGEFHRFRDEKKKQEGGRS